MSFATITRDLVRVDYDDADAALDAIMGARHPLVLVGIQPERHPAPIARAHLGHDDAVDLIRLARKAGVA